MRLDSYPSIYNLGHKAIADLFTGPVIVEEKVDGSQFSFGLVDGEPVARSKGAQLYIDAPEKMFANACATVKELAPQLTPGWTYRGEYLAKPKHNALAYDRVPAKHVILFDIQPGLETYLSPEEKAREAARLGLEVVPVFYQGEVRDPAALRELLEHVSVLGGQKIEGVVIKPAEYALYGPDKKVLMGKFVSEAFREVHAKSWAESNPHQKDILEKSIATYGTQARWAKAVQHLRERGVLQDDPRDIGQLMKEVKNDVERECSDEIRDIVFRWAWPHIARGLCRGLPEWYKNELLKKQFEVA